MALLCVKLTIKTKEHNLPLNLACKCHNFPLLDLEVSLYFFIFILCALVLCLHISNVALDPLKLESQTVVSCRVGAGK